MKVVLTQPKIVDIPEIFGDDNQFDCSRKTALGDVVKSCAVVHAVKVSDGGPFGHGVLIFCGARDLPKICTNK